MSIPIESPADIPLALVEDVKAFLRLNHAEDDGAIAGYIQSALTLCETFTGQMLIIRAVQEIVPARTVWQKLKRLPAQSITGVTAISADGVATALPATDYAVDIDSDGIGWVKFHNPGAVSRLRIAYHAGLSADWDNAPPALRQGVIRLAGYFYAHRDEVDAGAPPSAVTALWRPYRRMRLL